MSGGGFDDRDRSAERDGPTQDLDHDAPGFNVGGAAAVGQAAELSQGHLPPQQLRAAAHPAPASPAPKPALIEAAQPVVQLAPDGAGGGGTTTRGSAAQIVRPPPTSAVDASAQLHTTQALQTDALLDAPPARTPVALRARKKKKTPPSPQAEAQTDSTAE